MSDENKVNKDDFFQWSSEFKDYIHGEFTQLRHKIDKLFGKIENHNDRINKLEKKHEEIENKIDNKFSEIDKKIGAAGIIVVILAIAGKYVLSNLIGG